MEKELDKEEYSLNHKYKFITMLYDNIWFAKNEKDEKVLIKVYKNNDNVFKNELKSLKLLSKICKRWAVCYIDSYIFNDNPRIVMNFIKGLQIKTISTLIEKNQSNKIIYDLILGLNLLHSNGIAHQDIQNNNIIYDTEDKHYKYINFEHSCIKNDCDEICKEPCGYIPPERINDKIRNKDKYFIDYVLTDIWFLGVFLREWYSGKSFNVNIIENDMAKCIIPYLLEVDLFKRANNWKAIVYLLKEQYKQDMTDELDNILINNYDEYLKRIVQVVADEDDDVKKVSRKKLKMNNNDLIIANLQTLLDNLKTSKDEKDKFRMRAYANAIKAIKDCPFEIKSKADAIKLSGIGARIAEKIDEIIKTGALHQVGEIKTDVLEKNSVIISLSKVIGIGPKKAEELWSLGVRSISDLETDKYQKYLTHNQKIGVKYFDDLQKRVSRDQVHLIAVNIEKYITELSNEIGETIIFKVCGSYRRNAETCGDIDILLCEPSNGRLVLPLLVDKLKKAGILKEQLALGNTKYMGITQTKSGVYFRIDMEIIKEHEWPFALLYFTGSGSFNERQRLHAKKMGYSLSEHGIMNVKTKQYVQGLKTERDIFEFLGMDYLEPWERK
jgi:DNA polymerase beta